MTKIRKTITIHPDGLRVIVKEVLNDDLSLVSKEVRKLRLSNRGGASDDDSGYNSKVSYRSDEEDSHPRSYVSVHSDGDSIDTNATPTEQDVIRMISELSAIVIEMEKEKMKAEKKKAEEVKATNEEEVEVSKDDQARAPPAQGDRMVTVRAAADESTQATQPTHNSVTTVGTSRGGPSTGVPPKVTDDDILQMMQEVSLQATEEIRKSQRQLDVEPLSDEEQSLPSAGDEEEMPTEPTEQPKSAASDAGHSVSRDMEAGDGNRELTTTSASADQEPKKLEAIEDDGQQEVPKADIPAEENSGDSKAAATQSAPMNLSVFQEVNNALKNADKENAEQVRAAPSETPSAESHEDAKPVASDKSYHDSQDGRSRSYSSRSGSYSPRSRSYSSRSRSYSSRSRSRSYSSRSRSRSYDSRSRSRSYTSESRRSKDEHENEAAPPAVADREKVPEETARGDSKPVELGEKPQEGGDEVPAARNTAAPANAVARHAGDEKGESKPAGGPKQAPPATKEDPTRQPAPSAAEAENVQQVAPLEMTAAERSKAIATILNDKTLTMQERQEKIRALRPQKRVERTTPTSSTNQGGSEADARRRAIQAVHTNTSLTPQEKHKQIQDLLKGGPIPAAQPATAPISKPAVDDEDAKNVATSRSSRAGNAPHPTLVEFNKMPSATSVITGDSPVIEDSKPASKAGASAGRGTSLLQTPELPEDATSRDILQSSKQPSFRLPRNPVKEEPRPKLVEVGKNLSTQSAITLSSLEEKVSTVEEENTAADSQNTKDRSNADLAIKVVPEDAPSSPKPKQEKIKPVSTSKKKQQIQSVRSIDSDEAEQVYAMPSDDFEKRESMKLIPTSQQLMGFDPPSPIASRRASAEEEKQSESDLEDTKDRRKTRSGSIERRESPLSKVPDEGEGSRSSRSRSSQPYYSDGGGSYRSGDSRSYRSRSGSRSYYSDRSRSYSRSRSPYSDDGSRSRSRSYTPDSRSRSPYSDEKGDEKSRSVRASESASPPPAANDQEGGAKSLSPPADEQNRSVQSPVVAFEEQNPPSAAPPADDQNQKSPVSASPADDDQKQSVGSKSPSHRSDEQSGSARSKSRSASYTPDSRSRSRSYTPDSRSRSRSYTPDSRSRSRSYTPDSGNRSPHSNRSRSYSSRSRSYSSRSYGSRSYSSRSKSRSSRSYSSRSKSHGSRSYSSRSKSHGSRSYSSRSRSHDSPAAVVEGNEEVAPVSVTAAAKAEPAGAPAKKKGFKGFLKKFGKKK